MVRVTATSTCLFVIFGLPLLPASSSAASAAPGVGPIPAAGLCDMPTTSDLIVWKRRPRLFDSAFEIGDADLSQCKPTVDTWPAAQPTGPGYCSKIAWASDSPGYDTDARPSPPLKKVIEAVGDC